MSNSFEQLEVPRPHYRTPVATLAAESTPDIGDQMLINVTPQEIKDREVLAEATAGMKENGSKEENNQVAEQLRQQQAERTAQPRPRLEQATAAPELSADVEAHADDVISELQALVGDGQSGADQWDAAIAQVKQLDAQFQEAAAQAAPEPVPVAVPEPPQQESPQEIGNQTVNVKPFKSTERVNLSPEQSREVLAKVEEMKRQIAALEAQVKSSEKPAA